MARQGESPDALRDVVEHIAAMQAKLVGSNLHDDLGAEGARHVDVERLALAAALRKGQLARHTEAVADVAAHRRVHQDLGHPGRLYATLEVAIKLLAARDEGWQ